MRFVIDNSVVMRWLFDDGSVADQNYAARMLELLQEEDGQAMAPAV